MLRCGSATEGALRVRAYATSSLSSRSPLCVKRFASQWQARGEASKASSSSGGQKRSSNAVERLREEKETLREIQELRAKLATIDYQKKVETAGGEAVELDEDTLSTLYEAINTPDPPTPEELRLEAKRKRMLLNRGNEANLLDTQIGKKTALRLAILDERLRDVHPVNEVKEGAMKRIDLYESISLKLKDKGVFKEGIEDEDVLSAAKSEDRLQGLTSKSGEMFLQDAGARQQLLSKLQFLAQVLGNDTVRQEADAGPTLPLGIATKQEWEALARAFAYADEIEGVQEVLKAVDQSGHGSCLLQATNCAADIYAERGQVDKCQMLLSWMNDQGLVPDDHTHHCLVKSYLRSGSLDKAIDVLHQLEDSKPASITTYSLVLQSLLNLTDNPAIQSRAWTLFQRMRLVAHPIPDAYCYAQMIKACAKGVPQPNDDLWKPTNRLLAEGQSRASSKAQNNRLSEAERALDLFREMTNRYNIRPTVEVYSALIAACVQRNDMYERGWQLFRNMVEMEKARLINNPKDLLSFAPTREIFNSLLIGCAKNRDLLRARWILAEMLRSATLLWKDFVSRNDQDLEAWELQEVENRRPDEETISKLFFTYSSYYPPAIAIKKETLTNKEQSAARNTDQTDVKASQVSDSVDEDMLTYNVPSTGRAILREVMSLMERIKVDYKQKGGLLSSVRPNSLLIKSYISVISRFCREEDQVQHFRQIVFGNENGEVALTKHLEVEMNGWILMALLEYCSKLAHREELLKFTTEIWKEWIALGGDGHLFRNDPTEAKRLGLSATCIASMWSYLIKILAKHNRLDEAMILMRKFADLYPPTVQFNDEYRSIFTDNATSSTSLLKPLRGNDILLLQTKMANEPKLEFKLIDVLHHKLVEKENRQEDIKFMTWLLRAYNNTTKAKIPDSLRDDVFPSFSQKSTLAEHFQQKPTLFPLQRRLQRSHG